MSNRKIKSLVNMDSLKTYLDLSDTTQKKLLRSLDNYMVTHEAPDFELLCKDVSLSNREKIEQSVENLNKLYIYLLEVAQVYNKELKMKSGKYTKYYSLILSIYEEHKSIYKCQKELKKQHIDISLMQIYNILVKYGAIEKEH